MPRLIMIVFLALFLAAGSVACTGLDAARNAGERASGRDGEEPAAVTDPPAEDSAGSSAEERAQVAASEEARVSELVLDPKWYQDSDGNVVPDFIESENGFDPNKDDCAPEQCPGAAGGESADFLSKPRNALLVLDSSGSMAADDGGGAGRTKMDAAKEALTRYSGVSASIFETGFAVFGHTGDGTEAGKDQSCAEAAETLLSLGEVDPASFEGTLSRFQPTGWTPIEGALREAEEEFAGHEGDINQMVLVSDGIETCGGDPVAAEELRASGIELTIDVVGFGVPGDVAGQLRDIAAAGGGEYFDARTGADLDGYFQKQAEAKNQTIDAALCELRNGFHDTLCDQNQCNDAVVFRIPDEQNKYEYTSPEYVAFQDLSDRINAGFDERQKARDEASARAKELMDQYNEIQEEYNRALQEAYGF